MTPTMAKIYKASLLQVKALTVVLSSEPILDNIALEVMPETVHAIIGPNGGGKTTLMRSLLGGMPHQGEIRFRFRKSGRIGYVPQLLEFDHALPLTVCDLLSMMLQRRPMFLGRPRKRRKQILELLARTRCERLIDKSVGSLSGGEFRRVLLAQALAPMPELLLLDEPASNVDEYGARMFEQLLAGLCREDGLTIVMVSHDLSMILRVADHVTGINRRVAFSGEPERLDDPVVLARLFGGRPESLAASEPPSALSRPSVMPREACTAQ